MSVQVTNYKCPSCTGPLKFSSESGKLQCEYCENVYDVATIEALYEDANKAAAEAKEPQWDIDAAGSPWSEMEAKGLKVYNCPSCGAEIITDETTAATSCLYCGNPTVVPGQLGGNLKPDYVIPFKLNKVAAMKALKNHYNKKLLLPKEFKDENHIEEIKGVYVPFWLFDCDADAYIQYNGQKVRMWSSGDYDVTETSHYRVTREGEIYFQKVPADGSTKMPDAHMDAIEPYDYSEMVPFSTAYLPGFFADKYDVDAEESAQRVNVRMKNSTTDAFAQTVSEYTTCSVNRADIEMKQGSIKYALLPVWLLATKWKGNNYLFAMNGQTGKLIGDLPISKSKLFGWFFGIWGGMAALMGIAMFFLGFI
ncbi:MAG: hypothetical protein GX154_01160 [Clostridiales bacterium]|nr:hypothetical protein [Clostridiales bacterium]